MLKNTCLDFFARKLTHHLTTITTCTKHKMAEKEKMRTHKRPCNEIVFCSAKMSKKRRTKKSSHKMHELHCIGRLKKRSILDSLAMHFDAYFSAKLTFDKKTLLLSRAYPVLFIDLLIFS